MYSIFMYRSLQIQTSRRQCRGERNVIFPTKELLSTQFLELRDWAKKNDAGSYCHIETNSYCMITV